VSIKKPRPALIDITKAAKQHNFVPEPKSQLDKEQRTLQRQQKEQELIKKREMLAKQLELEKKKREEAKKKREEEKRKKEEEERRKREQERKDLLEAKKLQVSQARDRMQQRKSARNQAREQRLQQNKQPARSIIDAKKRRILAPSFDFKNSPKKQRLIKDFKSQHPNVKPKQLATKKPKKKKSTHSLSLLFRRQNSA
jgi:hypothetical protein